MPRMMSTRPAWRRLAMLTLALSLLLALLAAALLLLLPSQQARVAPESELSAHDVERALQLARRHDPRRAIPGVVRGLSLSPHEAELLLNLAAARLHPGRWALTLGAEQMQLSGSLRLPANPLGAWLNVELHWRQRPGLPQLVALRLGRLPLPPALAPWLLQRVLAWQGLSGWQAIGAATVQQVRLRPQRIDIVYAWSTDAPAQLVAALLPAREQERLRVYAERLAGLAAATPGDPGQPLSAVLPPLFALAHQRSAAGENAALENRAALLVLGMAANGIGLGTLLPARAAELATRPVRLTLAGRNDFPQHYLSSAVLAAETGTPLADLIGQYKELADARSGSGFSFNDIAANRAGTRIGELAVAAPVLLQQRLARSRSDLDLLPDVSDLPEFVSAAEFNRRYGPPGAAGYESMMRDIEARLAATPLLQRAP